MSARRLRQVVAVVYMALLFTPLAKAQGVDDATRNAARNLANEAKDSFDQRDFERARDLFHRAYTLVPAPTLALFEARSLASLGRLVEAEEAYMRAARTKLDSQSPEQFRKAVDDAENALVTVRSRIPKVIIAPTGPGARDAGLVITLDGNALRSALWGVEAPIDPGSHTLTGAAPGGQSAEVKFSIGEGERKHVDIDVPSGAVAHSLVAKTASASPSPVDAEATSRDAPSPMQKRVGFVVGGVGIAGLATGIVTGLMATSRHSQAESQCPRQVCVEGSAGQDAVDSFRSLRTVSTIGYIVGGVGLAGGAVLILTAPSSEKRRSPSASVNLWLNGSTAGVAGAF